MVNKKQEFKPSFLANFIWLCGAFLALASVWIIESTILVFIGCGLVVGGVIKIISESNKFDKKK